MILKLAIISNVISTSRTEFLYVTLYSYRFVEISPLVYLPLLNCVYTSQIYYHRLFMLRKSGFPLLVTCGSWNCFRKGAVKGFAPELITRIDFLSVSSYLYRFSYNSGIWSCSIVFRLDFMTCPLVNIFILSTRVDCYEVPTGRHLL